MNDNMSDMKTGSIALPALNLSNENRELKAQGENTLKESAPLSGRKIQKLEIDKIDKADKEINKPSLSLEKMQDMATIANKAFNVRQSNLQFSVDDSTKEVVMSVKDKETGEVIRQFPSKEALEMLQRIQESESNSGFFVQDKV